MKGRGVYVRSSGHEHDLCRAEKPAHSFSTAISWPAWLHEKIASRDKCFLLKTTIRNHCPSRTYELALFALTPFETADRRPVCPQIWRVAGRESGSPELLGSPRTSPEVPRSSPEVIRRLPRKFSHCENLTAVQRFPGSFPNFPGSSPDFPGSSGTSPEVSPFLWEA